MKKRLAIIASLTLVASVFTTSCGQADNSSSDKSDTPASVAGESEGSSEKPIVLTACTSFTEGAMLYDNMIYMCNYIEEQSNGTISFDIYEGGTLCSMPEEFSYVSSGAVDMINCMQGTASTALPFWQMCTNGTDVGEGVEIANYIAFENETTSPLMLQQAEDNHVYPLGYYVADGNAVCAAKHAENWEDLKGRAFGIPQAGAAIYESLGMSAVSCTNSDAYESLSRGVVDTFLSGLTTTVNLKLYEVTDTYLISSSYGANGIPMINLDTWNSLTENQQNLFKEAYEKTLEWSVSKYADETLPNCIQTIEDSGTEVIMLSEEDDALYREKMQESNYNSYVSAAESLGVLDEYYQIRDAEIEYAESLNAK